MGIIEVRLPAALQEVIDRQIAEGRVADVVTYLTEAARRYAEDLELEDDLVAEANAGIADIEAGRCTLIATCDDLATKEADVMARVRARLAAADKG